MDDGAGCEDIVGRVYNKAKDFLKYHTAASVMASGDRQLMREYAFSVQFVEELEDLFLKQSKYYRYLLL